jgi:hypothetical protein
MSLAPVVLLIQMGSEDSIHHIGQIIDVYGRICYTSVANCMVSEFRNLAHANIKNSFTTKPLHG